MGRESVGRISAVGPGVGDRLVPGRVATFNPVVIPAADQDRYLGWERHHPKKYVIGVRSDVSAAFAELLVVPARNVVPLPPTVPAPWSSRWPWPCTPTAGPAPGPVTVRSCSEGVLFGQSFVLALRACRTSSPAGRPPHAARSWRGSAREPSTAGPVSWRSRCAALDGPADVAVDAVWIDATMTEAALEATKPGGSVCLVGMGSPQLGLDAFQVSTEERSVVGSYTSSKADFGDAAAWVGINARAADVLVSDQVGLDEAAAAFSTLADGRGLAGKILVRLDRATTGAQGWTR